jgi:NAD(P)-dependent dehydrogenase (short-subunit alcohol dehydrogenase family)
VEPHQRAAGLSGSGDSSGRSRADVLEAAAQITSPSPLLPLRHVVRPEEVAALAGFLAGPESTFVAGAEHFVDGGQIRV